MARPQKKGLDYYPLDVDIFANLKIRKLIRYQGGKAVTIYTLLLCTIYKQGYYMRWDKELPFIISEQTGFDEAYILEVIKSCMAIGLFSKELFDVKKVITSQCIQERYKEICSLSRRICEISEYNLISSEKSPVSSEEINVSSEETPINSAESTQSKVNKTKLNNFKRNDLKEFFEIFFFKNFHNPAAEVDKFINHYARSGWKDANGNNIVDPIAAAHNWEQRKTKDTSPPFVPLLFERYKQLYDTVKQHYGEKSAVMMEVQKLLMQDNALCITCTHDVANRIKENLLTDDHFGETFKQIMHPLNRLMYTFTD